MKTFDQVSNEVSPVVLRNVAGKINDLAKTFSLKNEWMTGRDYFVDVYLMPHVKDCIKNWALRNIEGITEIQAEELYKPISLRVISYGMVNGLNLVGSRFNDVYYKVK